MAEDVAEDVAEGVAGEVTKDVASAVGDVAGSAGEMGSKFKFATKATTLFKGSLVALGVVVAGVAIAKLAKDLYDYNHQADIARKSLEDFNKTIDENDKNFEEQKKYVESISDEYSQLVKGVKLVNGVYESQSLSQKGFARFLEINQQLASMFPEIVDNINLQGQAILNLGDNSSKAAEYLQTLLDKNEQANNRMIADNMGQTQYDSYTIIDENLKKIEKLKQQVTELQVSQKDLKEAGQKIIPLLDQGEISMETISDVDQRYKMYELKNLYDQAIVMLKKNKKKELQKAVEESFQFNSGDGQRGLMTLNWDFNALSDKQKREFEDVLQDAYGVMQKEYVDLNEENQKQIAGLQSENVDVFAKYKDNLLRGMQVQGSYLALGENMDLADAFVKGLDESLIQAIQDYSPNDPFAYLRDKIFPVIQEMPDDIKIDFKSLISKTNVETGEELLKEQLIEISKRVKDYFEQHGLTLPLELDIVAKEEDVDKRVQQSINRLSKNDPADMMALKEVIDTFETTEEKEEWLELIDTINNAAEALVAYREKNKEAEEASTFTSYDNAVETLTKHAQVVYQVNKEIKNGGRISADSINDIASAFPKLDKDVIKFQSGLINSTTLFDLLEEAYADDEHNFELYTNEKLATTAEFYDKVKLNMLDSFKDLCESYDLELEKCADTASAKLIIEQNLADKKTELQNISNDVDYWAEMMNGEGSNSQQVQYEMMYQISFAAQNQAEQRFLDSQKIVDEFNQLVADTLKKNSMNTNWLLMGAPKGNKETEETVEWIANSLENLNNAVEKSQQALEDAHGYKAQHDALQQLNADLDLLKTKYEEASGYYEDKFKKSDYNKLVKLVGTKKATKYLEQIQSGDIIPDEVLKSNSDDKVTVYDLLTKMMSDYKKYVDYANQADETERKITENSILDHKNQEEEYSKELSVINEKLNDQSLNVIQKNQLLEEQYEKQKAINNELREQAKLEGDLNEQSRLDQEDENNQLDKELSQIQGWRDVYAKNDEYYQKQIDDPTKTFKEIQTTLVTSRQNKNEDLRKQFEEEFAKIDDTTLEDYLTYLKEYYKEKDVENEEFIKNHLAEISAYFQGQTNLGSLYLDYFAQDRNQTGEDYDFYSQYAQYSIDRNNNAIKNIRNKIDLNNGNGTVDDYKTIIALTQSNQQTLADQLVLAEKNLEAAKENTAEYKKWDDEVQRCKDEIQGCNMTIKECTMSLLKLPLQDIQQCLSEISVDLASVNYDLSHQNTLIDAAIGSLDKEITRQNTLKDGIQKQIDALQEEKSIRDDNLALSKAQYNLEKLKNQRSTKVFKQGQGWVFEADEDALRNAQEEYDNALFNHKIETLNRQQKLYDDEIERLNQIKEKWSNVVQEAQLRAKVVEATAYDENFINKVLSGDLTILQQITSEYDTLSDKQNKLTMQQEKYQLLEEVINGITELYQANVIDADEAGRRILQSIETYYPKMAEKYKELYGSVDNFIQLKLQEKKDIDETSQDNADKVQKSNQIITDSYTEMQDAIEDTFSHMMATLNNFAKTAQEMADKVKESVSQANLAMLNLNKDKVNVEDIRLIGVRTGIGLFTQHHNGMEGGYIGSHTSEDKDRKLFEKMALQPLKPDEYPSILQKSEAVLTPTQQKNILNNFYKATNLPTLKPISTAQSVAFNGDIIVQAQNNDINSLAKAIKTNLPNAMIQSLYDKK